MQRPHRFSDLQFKDRRRKAKFMAARMVPNTSRRGSTPVPKAAARATIHSTITTVKIVQNTALPPERVVTLKLQSLVKKLRRLVDRSGQRLRVGETIQLAYPARSSDPISVLRVVCALVPKSHICKRNTNGNSEIKSPRKLESLISERQFWRKSRLCAKFGAAANH